MPFQGIFLILSRAHVLGVERSETPRAWLIHELQVHVMQISNVPQNSTSFRVDGEVIQVVTVSNK
jgi:hypothetical protein